MPARPATLHVEVTNVGGVSPMAIDKNLELQSVATSYSRWRDAVEVVHLEAVSRNLTRQTVLDRRSPSLRLNVPLIPQIDHSSINLLALTADGLRENPIKHRVSSRDEDLPSHGNFLVRGEP